MNKIAVLSNESQYKAVIEKYTDINDISIFCDNPAFYDFLNDKKIKFQKLDEDLFIEKRDSINSWLREKALLWGNVEGVKDDFNSIEFAKILYVYFFYYLGSFIKNHIFAKYVYENFRPKEVIIFDDVYSPQYPNFNGNYFINLLLKYAANRYEAKIISLHCHEKLNVAEGNGLKTKLRNVIKKAYRYFISIEREKDVFIACGSLNHLAPVIRGLKNEGREIILYDFDFHLDQFKFCRKEGVRYCLAECFPITPGQKTISQYDYEPELAACLDVLKRKRWFEYGGENLSDIICGEFIEHCEEYMKHISRSASVYSNIISSYNVKGLILDEDIAPIRAFMAAFFKSKGMKTFCVSHGYFALRDLPKDFNGIYDLSNTFVNSGYEKSFYEVLGWDRLAIEVTGIPRYDTLHALYERRRKLNTGKGNMRILFCPATFAHFTPDKVSYLGVSMYEYRSYMERYLSDIIASAKRCQAEIIIKPRYKEDEFRLKDLLRGNEYKNNITVESFSSNLFELMSQANLVILGHWATTIMESIIVGTPVVVMDYSGLKDGFPFAEQALSSTVRNFDQLGVEIDKIYLSFSKKEINKNIPGRDKDKVFYTGINDGNNTSRVINSILNKTGNFVEQ